VEGGEHPLQYVAALLVGYLLGSVPVAALVARRHGVDLHSTGDGNPGAWNALEQLGPRRAWPAFVGDAAKGLAAGLAGLVLAATAGAYAAALGAMVGHALPAFDRLRGGKAVMPFVGAGFAFATVPALAALALCLLVTAVAGSFAWGARAGVFAFPLAQLALAPVEQVAATGGLMTLIGLLFWVRRPSRARSGTGTAPTT
jgi:glycerol-3-phosphate acyltransferase PlsY